MKILYVYAHPAQHSFNQALREHAILTLLAHGHDVKLSNLYKMNFKAVANWQDFTDNNLNALHQYGVAQKLAFDTDALSDDIKEEQEKLLWCDTLVLQFPFWWFSMPAILKGWFDRVFAAGFAYDKGKWFDAGSMQPRRAVLAITTQAPVTSYGANGLNGDINQLLIPLHQTLRFVGFTPLMPFVAYGVMNADESTRQNYIHAYGKHLLNIEQLVPLPFNLLTDFDEQLVLKTDVERKIF